MEVAASTSARDRTPLVVPAEASGRRLDVFLLDYAVPTWTRGAVQRAIRDGSVTIAGKRVVKPSTLVRTGHEIRLVGPPEAEQHRVVTEALPPLNILHEDSSLLVLNKPAGVAVHAGVRREPSLADALVVRYPGLRDVGEDPQRPGPPASASPQAMRAGIVHRLDKETSGVLLVARTPEMYEHLKNEFQRRRVRKEYLALVHGIVPEDHGSVKVVGDPLYGRKSRHRTPQGLTRQFLHAHTITVTLPLGKTRTFTSPLTDDLAAVLAGLRGLPDRPTPLGYRWRTPRAPQN
ncbi:MAG: 23S rRNA pseudouridine synthase [Parcubacteria group bacterium Gr01-1014_38]|nr:MAG: 23S rRNA pseudouridine synthase [Parcubacteria group bacterium Gr01-1014_38]